MKKAYLTGGNHELGPDDLSEKAEPKPKNLNKKGGLSKYQKFEAVTIHRSQIKNAPYNPRTITPEAKARLRKNLKEVGLLGGIIWNRSTGNLLAGHQRISVLDALEGSEDYELTVDAVELTLKKEKEQNIFLNSTAAQGRFDWDKMAVMLPDIDADLSGLDKFDLAQMGQTIVDLDLGSSLDMYVAPPPPSAQERTPEQREQAKTEMQEKRQAAGAVLDSHNEVLGESHVTVSFNSAGAKEMFLQRFGWPGAMRMVKGEELVMKIDFEVRTETEKPPF